LSAARPRQNGQNRENRDDSYAALHFETQKAVINKESRFHEPYRLTWTKVEARMNRQSGQAIIEYLLVLVVVIGLILGLGYKFNSAFRAYVDSFFGKYVSCLLETGELPALGSGVQGYCSQNFNAQFDPNAGSPLPGAGEAGGSSGGSNGGSVRPNSPQAQSQSSPSPGGGGQSAAPTSDGGGVRGTDGINSGGGGGGPQSAGSLFNRSGRATRTAVGEVGGEEGVKYTGSIAPLNRGRTVGEVAGENGRMDRMTLDRRFFSEQDFQEKRSTSTNEAAPSAEGGEGLRPKKTQYEVKRSTAVAGEHEEGFSIGKLLRFLLIFVIIGTLVLLIGGQVLQISKSGEK
jgi:hypothetical protein